MMPPPESWRILFIYPPQQGGDVGLVMPPLGLTSLAAVTRENGHQVELLDAAAEKLDLPSVISRVTAHSPWHCIGITATTPTFSTAQKIAKAVGTPFTKVILGGPHLNGLAAEGRYDLPDGFDAGIIGEGEDALQELISYWQTRERNLPLPEGVLLPGHPFRKRTRPVDLERLPLPARDLLPNHLYRSPLCPGRRPTSLITTRGCPHHC
ncbi:MAG TPA: cobalamin B12-binding domain-containing protein, partial [Candidatus Ozemobacteraceae bacterium]|nr:cobalamin B12-binding domain-containing protein [Candidatus Ozemobacteraceae bacterium]